MKKVLKFATLLLTIVAMASCDMLNKDDKYGTEAQLIGRWQNATQQDWYRVFYADNAGDGYKWGKEWHEKEVREDQLTEHGNGWFKWKKTGKDLFEIEFMEYDFAEIPQENTITLLTDDRLEYTEQDGRKCQFNKIVEVK